MESETENRVVALSVFGTFQRNLGQVARDSTLPSISCGFDSHGRTVAENFCHGTQKHAVMLSLGGMLGQSPGVEAPLPGPREKT